MGDDPAWLNNPPAPGDYSNNQAQGGKQADPNKQRFTYLLRFANIGIAVFMAATGAFGLLTIENMKVQDASLSIYLMLFAVLLFIFELRLERLQPMMKKNFGFMYGLKGRGIFLFFVAFLNFGIDVKLALGCGVVVMAVAIAHIVMYTKFGDEPRPQQQQQQGSSANRV